MDTRRRWLGNAIAIGTVTLCGCGLSSDTETSPTPAPASPSPAARGPQAWEPVDPKFTGCGGG